MSSSKTVFVYDSFSSEEPGILGRLYVDQVRGGEVCSFEYDAEWLRNTGAAICLDPELQPYSGRQFPVNGGMFGVFSDASPDRWGRMLMNRRERINARTESRKPAKLLDSDYLLGVYDKTRMGGLRFKLDPDRAFLSDDGETPVPPWARLRTLEEASRKYEMDESGAVEKWLEQLIRPGSSLGGARPKATVIDQAGDLWIAMFPSKHDENDAGAWEKVTHDPAE